MALAILLVYCGIVFSPQAGAARPHDHADTDMMNLLGTDMMELMGFDHAPRPDEFVAWALLQDPEKKVEELGFTTEALKKASLAVVLFDWKLQRIEKAIALSCQSEAQSQPTRVEVSAGCEKVAEGTSVSCEACRDHYEGSNDAGGKCVYVIPQSKCFKAGKVEVMLGNSPEAAAEDEKPDWLSYDETECPQIDNTSDYNVIISKIRAYNRHSAIKLSATTHLVNEKLLKSNESDIHATHMAAVGSIKDATQSLAGLMENEEEIVKSLDVLKDKLQAASDDCEKVKIDVERAKVYVQVYGKVVWVKAGCDILNDVVGKLEKMKEIQLAKEQEHGAFSTQATHSVPDTK